jgi:hypothetical protein
MAEPRKNRGPSEGPSLPDKVISIHEALLAAKIPHAIGGALALAYYAEPRATIDIDLNVFVPADEWERVIGVLGPLGVSAEGLDAAALVRDGQCRLWWEDNPIDLFFAHDPIHEEMRRDARRLPFADETLPFLAPEHLAICKAVFDRPKDWIDIEQMIVAVDDFDLGRVETWLRRLTDERDPRLRRLKDLAAAVGRP